MAGKFASIELYKKDDGNYKLSFIHWIGKPYDGFWQYHEIGEEDVKKILDIFPAHEIPESCKKCDYFWDLDGKPPYTCRISDPPIRLFDGETVPEKMTIPAMMSDKWLTETPHWCPLKEKQRG